MIVLGIESSCDETGVALYAAESGLLAHALYSQVELHARFGGVVPELASRDHVRKLLPLVDQVIDSSGINRTDIDGVAYTAGPGLVGALLVGATTGRSLAWTWGVPAIAVHHMEGHLLAPMLEADPPEFPFLALLVSGGHSLLVSVAGVGDYQLLGDSVDVQLHFLGLRDGFLPYDGGEAKSRLREISASRSPPQKWVWQCAKHESNLR